MSIKLTTTREAAQAHGLKILVHGPAGAGKTTLASTTGGPTIIISAEAGLLSLRNADIPVIQVSTMQDVIEAYQYMQTDDCAGFQWIVLDSISEIAEVVLSAEKEAHKDIRQAYGALQEQMMSLLRAFRDLPGRHVVFTAKQERVKDEVTGITLYVPMMPGAKLSQQIPYLFDEVFALRIEKDANGDPTRAIQTNRDISHEAKDRSGALDMYEPPNLAAIAAKILNQPKE